ncbi:MAG: patatin-like phospholipase family protein [Anaerolineae bacterium]
MAVAGLHPAVPSLRREHIFRFNQREFLRRGFLLPARLVKTLFDYVRNPQNSTLVDALWSLTDVLPARLYDGMALESYMRRALASYGGANDFRALKKGLFIIATDLDSGQRVVFGTDENSDVPILLAVAASTALPMLYKPVRIGDHEYVDGGMRGTASLDIAIEHGATLVVCINPLVPFDNTRQGNGAERTQQEFFSRRGFFGHCVAGVAYHHPLRFALSDQTAAPSARNLPKSANQAMIPE